MQRLNMKGSIFQRQIKCWHPSKRVLKWVVHSSSRNLKWRHFSPFYILSIQEGCLYSKLYMCCWPVNHSSWGEKSFSKDFILHELNEYKRSSCSDLWLIKKKKNFCNAFSQICPEYKDSEVGSKAAQRPPGCWGAHVMQWCPLLCWDHFWCSGSNWKR